MKNPIELAIWDVIVSWFSFCSNCAIRVHLHSKINTTHCCKDDIIYFIDVLVTLWNVFEIFGSSFSSMHNKLICVAIYDILVVTTTNFFKYTNAFVSYYYRFWVRNIWCSPHLLQEIFCNSWTTFKFHFVIDMPYYFMRTRSPLMTSLQIHTLLYI